MAWKPTLVSIEEQRPRGPRRRARPRDTRAPQRQGRTAERRARGLRAEQRRRLGLPPKRRRERTPRVSVVALCWNPDCTRDKEGGRKLHLQRRPAWQSRHVQGVGMMLRDAIPAYCCTPCRMHAAHRRRWPGPDDADHGRPCWGCGGSCENCGGIMPARKMRPDGRGWGAGPPSLSCCAACRQRSWRRAQPPTSWKPLSGWTCEECGAPTKTERGPGRPPKRCPACRQPPAQPVQHGLGLDLQRPRRMT